MQPIVPRNLCRGFGVAALLITETGRYLMQRRDDIDSIWFPGCWGLFGGLVEPDEAPETAIRRELFEELEYQAPPSLSYFSQVVFDLGAIDAGLRCRYFFEVPLQEGAIQLLRQHEGAGMRLFDRRSLLLEEKVVPYDVFAVLLHVERAGMSRARSIP